MHRILCARPFQERHSESFEGESALRQLEESGMRDGYNGGMRQDSGHDVGAGRGGGGAFPEEGGGGFAPKSPSATSWGRSKGKSKEDKKAAALFAAGKVEEAAHLGLPVAMGVMSER